MIKCVIILDLAMWGPLVIFIRAASLKNWESKHA